MNLSDIIRDVAIPTTIGIFSLMTPILLEALSRIDNKYNSVILVTAFKRELLYKQYVFTLLASIVSIVIWCLNLPRIVNIPWLNNFIFSYYFFGSNKVIDNLLCSKIAFEEIYWKVQQEQG